MGSSIKIDWPLVFFGLVLLPCPPAFVFYILCWILWPRGEKL